MGTSHARGRDRLPGDLVSAIVFIESNTTGTGRIFVERSLALGLQVHFVTARRAKYGFIDDAVAKGARVHDADTQDLQALDDLVAGIDEVVAVFSTSELFIGKAAHLAERRGLFGSPSAAIERCRDKLALAECLLETGPRAPATERLTKRPSFGGPWVVKPRHGTGSCGVRLVDDANELATIAAEPSYEGDELLVQSYIEGPEFSVELIGDGVDVHVLGVVGKHLGPAPWFVEVGHDCPAAIEEDLAAEIARAAVDAVRHVGLIRGAAHVELKATPHGVCIIEINPRLAGGMIPVALDASSGGDVIGLMLDLYLGRAVDLTLQSSSPVSIRFLLAQEEGRVASIDGLEAAAKEEGVLRAGPMTVVGRDVELRGDFRDRIAYVLAGGDTTVSSAARAAQALTKVSYQVG